MWVSDKSAEQLTRRFVGDILRENEITRRAVVSLKSAKKSSVEIHTYLAGRLSRFQKSVALNLMRVIGSVYAGAVGKDLSELTESDMRSVERVAYVTLSKVYGLVTRAQEMLFKDSNKTFVQDSPETEEEYYNALIDAFHERGLFDQIEVKGHKWNLSAYCRMVARTAVARIKNQAIANNNDTDLFLINKIGDDRVCSVCKQYEGKVFSRSGNDPRYPVLPASMRDYGTFHPNCRHVLIPIFDKQSEKDISKEVSEIVQASAAETEHAAQLKKQERMGQLIYEYETARDMFPGEFPAKFSTFLKHWEAQDALGRKYKRLITLYVRNERADWRSFRQK